MAASGSSTLTKPILEDRGKIQEEPECLEKILRKWKADLSVSQELYHVLPKCQGRAGCLQGESFWFLPRVRWAVSPSLVIKKAKGTLGRVSFHSGKTMRDARQCPWICNTSLLGLVQACLPDQPGQAWSVWTWLRAGPWQGSSGPRSWGWWWGGSGSSDKDFSSFPLGPGRKETIPQNGGLSTVHPAPPRRGETPQLPPKQPVAPRVPFYPLLLPPTEWSLILNGTVIFPVSQSVWSFLGFFFPGMMSKGGSSPTLSFSTCKGWVQLSHYTNCKHSLKVNQTGSIRSTSLNKWKRKDFIVWGIAWEKQELIKTAIVGEERISQLYSGQHMKKQHSAGLQSQGI